MFARHSSRYIGFSLALVALLILSACTSPGGEDAGGTAPTATPAPNLSPSHVALVTSIEFVMLESFPVQVHAIVRGALPDACTTIQSATATRMGNDFTLTLTTTWDPSAACTQAETPFEQNIPLDVYGLPKGVYTASANGVSASFELISDNILQSDPTQPSPVGSNLPAPSSISGSVWADHCTLLGGEGAPAAPSGGCVPDGNGGYRANGVWGEGEGRIVGIVVSLAPGPCPGDSSRLITTDTDSNGAYRFDNLNAGTYCVSIDAQQPQNLPLLIPGDWTFPAVGGGYTTLALGAGENKTNVDFGWDAQFN